jgi:hypothetical protein
MRLEHILDRPQGIFRTDIRARSWRSFRTASARD